MAAHKIVDCAKGTDEDDVVTLRGLTAYYRIGSLLNINRQQIKNLAPGTSEKYAATLEQCSNLFKAYDKALSRAFREFDKSLWSGGSSAAYSSARAAFSRASGAAVDRVSATVRQYKEIAAQTRLTLLSAEGSIVSNTANGIGNAIFSSVQQDQIGKFVAKSFIENLDMARHQIKELA